ncbi:hypothetical protein [Spiroplasma clarkii]|uniref:hypothetical protein n=1 Tax=Spiroplasma clarkii TaxID=2139 RepID=UPI0011BA8992|nr:hypothetical protein [Spiroplasma clarkii]
MLKISYTFGFNNVEKPRNPFELASKRLSINNSSNDISWNQDQLGERKYDDVLTQTKIKELKNEDDNKNMLLIWLENSSLDYQKISKYLF